MDESKFAEQLREVLAETQDASLFINQHNIQRIDTFEEAGVLTANAGLVVTLVDGSEYQLTIVRSRTARG